MKPETKFDEALEQELYSAWLELATLINRGLNFTDNFNALVSTVADTGLANTEFTIAHGLKRIPSGYLIVNQDKAATVYASGTAWTVTNIYLKASAANVALGIVVF